ncbi:hypothetical protein M758_8G017700 [Ceratodon purpureus]|uniref:Uncharacterized protein n=1 Tax=Ceratodon purpureus TaxID=3225 RepID=A0A8T0GXJ7_CERPU|nr:hypothetical protein KC19_8G018300 [Ceratodon purpureus]KAG0607300.1 hypothetical protein M758_8G017700 [Ceratodon purpureus]
MGRGDLEGASVSCILLVSFLPTMTIVKTANNCLVLQYTPIHVKINNLTISGNLCVYSLYVATSFCAAGEDELKN